MTQTTTQRLVRAVCLRASRLGDRLGWNWLTYNHGVYLHFQWMGERDAPRMADAVLEQFPAAKTLCDVGCGTGVFAAEFKRRGLTVSACEYSATARRRAAKQGIHPHPFDVSQSIDPLPGAPFDVAMSLEVAEHIPPPLADRFVDFMLSAGRSIVLTAAHPGQGGQGHINEQPKSYWIAKFEARGRRFDPAATARVAASLERSGASDYLSQNMMVFLG